VSILLTFFILAFVLILLFLGGSIFLQTWLYNVPANHIVYRALASGGGVALFLTLWTWIDASNPGNFGTLTEFSSYDVKEYNSVDSVYKKGNKEQIIPFRKKAGGKGSKDFVNEKNKSWHRNDTDGLMIALLIKEENKDEPTRFEVKLENDKFPAEIRYFEQGGSRYIDEQNIGRIVRTRGGLVFLNLLFNFLHLVVWVCALWFGMHYVFGHALGIGFALWLFNMLLVMPVVFESNRPKTQPQTSPPTIKTESIVSSGKA
jgi:hypothetical protein